MALLDTAGNLSIDFQVFIIASKSLSLQSYTFSLILRIHKSNVILTNNAQQKSLSFFQVHGKLQKKLQICKKKKKEKEKIAIVLDPWLTFYVCHFFSSRNHLTFAIVTTRNCDRNRPHCLTLLSACQQVCLELNQQM